MLYLEKLSDRAAAHNLRYRLDWKIALGLEVDFSGAHSTTFVYFRDRLIGNAKASYAFDRVIEYLTDKGLIKKGSKQRIDSTHVIAVVRELSRLELFHDTLRLFCQDVSFVKDSANGLLQEKIEFYQEEISTRGITDKQKNQFIQDAGLTMRLFINWVKQSDKKLKLDKFSSFKTMSKVFEQNFEDNNTDPSGDLSFKKVATGKDHICSPHEVDARYATKGGKSWLGYKAQIAETVHEGSKSEKSEMINFITHIELNEATDHDSSAIDSYVRDQEIKNITPSDVYGDTHYNSSENIETLLEKT